ncbi:hypothetical protein ScPMuIL_003333 [Solemya velum]
MSAALLKSKSQDVPEVNLDDLDDLLSKLTEAEIEELVGDYDPDNSLLPPSERLRNQTTKGPTGKFKRAELMKFLEKKAKEDKDWEERLPFTKEKRGKVFKPKEVEKTEEEEKIETEWDDLLTAASEEELVDLAAVLGFHGMLNQTQYYASWQGEKIKGGGFSGIAQSLDLKMIPDAPPNPTDVAESIEKVKNNDEKLKHLNLNNIKNISHERLCAICEGLKTNTHMEILEMASVAMTDKVAKKLAEGLAENKTLQQLNAESNFLSGDSIVEIIKAVNKNKTLIELRLANQKPEVMGNKIEMEITKLIEENDTILQLGLAFEFPAPRIRVHEKLQENNDQLRKDRVGTKGDKKEEKKEKEKEETS